MCDCFVFLPLSKGVPQGSVPGLVLFIIYINNITSSITHCNTHLYADYRVLYCCAKTAHKAITVFATVGVGGRGNKGVCQSKDLVIPTVVTPRNKARSIIQWVLACWSHRCTLGATLACILGTREATVNSIAPANPAKLLVRTMSSRDRKSRYLCSLISEVLKSIQEQIQCLILFEVRLQLQLLPSMLHQPVVVPVGPSLPSLSRCLCLFLVERQLINV